MINLIIILSVIIVILIIVIVFLILNICKNKKTKFDENDLALYYRNKISMVEYYYREYKEGANPYTVMRKLGDLLYNSVIGGDKIDFN